MLCIQQNYECVKIRNPPGTSQDYLLNCNIVCIVDYPSGWKQLAPTDIALLRIIFTPASCSWILSVCKNTSSTRWINVRPYPAPTAVHKGPGQHAPINGTEQKCRLRRISCPLVILSTQYMGQSM
jgi:hypothetical protein